MLRRIALAGVVLAIAVITLYPGSTPSTVFGCVICGERGVADILNNIILFVPLGVTLRLNGWSWKRALVASFLVSGVVEAAQATVVPGRDPSPTDLVCNAFGAWLGGTLPGLTRRAAALPAAASRRAGFAAASLTVAACAAIGFLFLPARPIEFWYGQWMANLGGYEWYRGRVLAARIGDMPLPDRKLGRLRSVTREVSRRMKSGDTVRVRFVAGPSPSRLAPVFSIFDERPVEIFLLGQERSDLVAQLRLNASDVLLDQPFLRLPGALRQVQPGDTVELAFARHGGRYCLAVDGAGDCQGFSPVRGWSLLSAPRVMPEWLRDVTDALAGAALLLGVGFLGAGWPLAVAAAAAGLAVVPLLVGIQVTPLHGWLGAAAGYAAGAAARRLYQARAGDLA